MITINDKKFYKYLNETLEDFIGLTKMDELKSEIDYINRVIKGLRKMIRERTFNLYDASLILEITEVHLQAPMNEVWNQIRKEHLYMMKILEKYFVFETSPILSVSWKNL